MAIYGLQGWKIMELKKYSEWKRNYLEWHIQGIWDLRWAVVLQKE